MADFGGRSSDYAPTTFQGEADFRQAHFRADAAFLNANFEQNALFDGSRCESVLNFVGVTFRRWIKLREATVRVLYFSRSGRVNDEPQADEQFHGPVDMRGCSYDRLYEQIDGKTNWQSLVRRFEPNDRQPYSQLEKIFRSMGRDDIADRVYIAQQDKERELKWVQKDYDGWFFKWLYRMFLNYGVRPYRLIFFSAVLIGIGAIIFSQPGALEREKADENKDQPVAASRAVAAEGADKFTVSKRDALGVSLRYFFPINIIMGSRLVPSRNPVGFDFRIFRRTWCFKMRPTTYATFFLQLAGWILVPLSVAAVTGLLKGS